MIMDSTTKFSLCNFVSNLKGFLQIDLSIKLFGVEVFKFSWPPQSNGQSIYENSNNSNYE